MAKLTGLIRIRKHAVELKQKALGELYRQQDVIRDKKQKMLDKLEHERKALEHHDMVEATAWYGRFAEGLRGQIERLNKEIDRMEVRISIAREDLRAAYAEQKKIEIVDRRQKATEEKEAQNKEDKELDDIAVEGFRRKEKE